MSTGVEMNAADYDPELPFLAELEKHVRTHAEQTLRRSQASTRAVRIAPGTRWWTMLAGRMTRRTAILVGLLCLLGASAFGARSVLSTGMQSPIAVRQGALVLVAGGHDGEDKWTLRMYTRDGQLCRALLVLDQTESSRCAPRPGMSALGVSGLSSALHSYVFGVVGSHVRAVRVHSASRTFTVETHTPSGKRSHIAGLSSSARYFVGVLERPLSNEDPPALLTALDAAHRPIGKARIVCLQEAGPPPCGP